MKTRNRLEFDVLQLESRLMLAGSVEVRVSGGGDLIVRGDGEDNRILVTGNASGEVTIRGLDGTIIQEGSTTSDEVTVNGVVDDVKIRLRGGNNTILIPQLTVADDLSVRTGSGSDVIALSQYHVGDDVSVSSGGGSDDVWLMFSTPADNVLVRTGSGNDLVSVGASAQSKLSVATGDGNDGVILVNYSSSDGTTVRAGGGDDFVYNNNSTGNLKGGGGHDTVNRDSNNQLASFENESIEAVVVAFAADTDTGISSQDHTFAEHQNPVDAFAATQNVVAIADTFAGDVNTDVNVVAMGIGFAIAATGTDCEVHAGFRI